MGERRSAKPEDMPQEMWDRSTAGATEQLHWAMQDLGQAIGDVLEARASLLVRAFRRLRGT